MQLSSIQKQIHEQAVRLSKEYLKLESELVLILQKVEETKLFKVLEYPSLFIYAVKELGLSEAVAYSFITVARKAKEVSELERAVIGNSISVSKASRIVSAVTKENAKALIEFARTNSKRETEILIATIRPQIGPAERTKFLSDKMVRLERNVSKATLMKLERVVALMAGKKNPLVAFDQIFDALLEDYLEHHDPVRRAQRSQLKKKGRANENLKQHVEVGPLATEKLCPGRVKHQKPPTKRQPLTAKQKHAVFARDDGRCTHVNRDGQRCQSDRWIHIHHIVPVSQGGGNHPGNLTTLCAFHHDLVHQLELPLEGNAS